MDHLLRNSEKRGAGRLRSPRLPTSDLLFSSPRRVRSRARGRIPLDCSKAVHLLH